MRLGIAAPSVLLNHHHSLLFIGMCGHASYVDMIIIKKAIMLKIVSFLSKSEYYRCISGLDGLLRTYSFMADSTAVREMRLIE